MIVHRREYEGNLVRLTVSGPASLLGRLPKVGESVTCRNLRFTVESMRGRRIDKLHVELLEGTP